MQEHFGNDRVFADATPVQEQETTTKQQTITETLPLANKEATMQIDTTANHAKSKAATAKLKAREARKKVSAKQ